jgi:hypothetical protein
MLQNRPITAEEEDEVEEEATEEEIEEETEVEEEVIEEKEDLAEVAEAGVEAEVALMVVLQEEAVVIKMTKVLGFPSPNWVVSSKRS